MLRIIQGVGQAGKQKTESWEETGRNQEAEDKTEERLGVVREQKRVDARGYRAEAQGPQG